MSVVLWHIEISHYSEKVRWALDRKGIEYRRRAPAPGAHMAVALWLTRGAHKTFPVIELDGRATGDSSEIIAALDEYRPQPRLIPREAAERARALELETFFDEELGPHIRLLAFHELRRDPEALSAFAERVAPAPLARHPAGRAVGARFAGTYSQLRYRVAGEDAAATAREKVIAALDRLDSELAASGGRYLVGGSFTVADLTAAAMFMPLAQPPEGPNRLDLPEPLQEFRAGLSDRPGWRWVLETFARERFARPSPAP